MQIGVDAAIGCYAWEGTTDNFGALCPQVARACMITNAQVTPPVLVSMFRAKDNL